MRWAATASILAIAAVAACLYTDAGMIPGVRGPMVLPMYVAAEPEVDEGELEQAAALWNDRAAIDLFELHPEMYADCMDWGCDGVVTVYRAVLEDDVRALAIVTVSNGEVAQCEVVLNSLWDDEHHAIAHELGHCLGLAHDADPESVMYPVAGDGVPTAHDVECALRGCEE